MDKILSFFLMLIFAVMGFVFGCEVSVLSIFLVSWIIASPAIYAVSWIFVFPVGFILGILFAVYFVMISNGGFNSKNWKINRHLFLISVFVIVTLIFTLFIYSL